MIICCSREYNPIRTIFVMPDFKYRDRKLEIAKCPVCGRLIAELTQFNVELQKYEKIRPKKRKLSELVKSVEAGEWSEIKIRHGSVSNTGFIYGVNREMKNGEIRQYSVDFNGNKNLVKKYSSGI